MSFSQSYSVIENKIYTPEGCEINVVYHCNLSCRSCSHLSPTFKQEFVSPDRVFHDLQTLAKFYRPAYIKLLGGEPLLHPELIQVIKAIRQSGISERIQICTNGKLLLKMPDIFWEQVNEISLSLYPGQEPGYNDIKKIQSKAKNFNVSLSLSHFDNFRESYTELGTTDTQLVRRIYSTCKIVHIWRCHTVADGYFYKCPLSFLIPKVISNENPKLNHQDGIKITDSSEFGGNLLDYLQSSNPLLSCNHCLGSIGKLRPHEQTNRKTWRSLQSYPTEEMVDMKYLAELEKNPDADESCVRGKRQKRLITNVLQWLSEKKNLFRTKH